MTNAQQVFIYKITTARLWVDAQQLGVLPPSPIDRTDGYMHFSTRDQLLETLALHFKGQSELVLLRVPTAGLGDALVWEPSRGDQLFPHLYAALFLSVIDGHITVSVAHDGSCEIPRFFL